MNMAREEGRVQTASPLSGQVLYTEPSVSAHGRQKLQPQQLRRKQHQIIYERLVAAKLLGEQRPALAVFTHRVSDLHL